MSDIKWIKLSINMFNDEKIKLIRTMPEGDKIIVTWVQLLCLAGKTNDSGGIYMGQHIYYTDEMLATLCDQPVNIMRIALKTLAQFGMIEWLDNGLIQIVNWERHQSTDKMAQIKEQNRIRQQKYYYRNQLRLMGYEESDMPDDLNKLKELSEKPNVSMTLPNDTEVRSKKLEERSKKKHSPKQVSDVSDIRDDFEKLWKLYPKKMGSKEKAFKSYSKAIKEGVTNKQIQDGIVNYKKHIKLNEISKQYIAYGDKWFNNKSWEFDYDNTEEEQKNKPAYANSNWEEELEKEGL